MTYESYAQSQYGAVSAPTQRKNLTRSEFAKEYLLKGSYGEIKQLSVNGSPVLYADLNFESTQRALKAETWRAAAAAGMKLATGETDKNVIIYFDSKRDDHKSLIARLAGLEPVVKARRKSTTLERREARRNRLYAEARIDARKKKAA